VASRAYLEQALGIWRPEGGSAALVDTLVARLALRGVTVHADCSVLGLLERADGSVGGIRTAAGDQHADVVVLTVGIPEFRAILAQTTKVRGLGPIRSRLRFVRSAPVPNVSLATMEQSGAPTAFETVFHRQSAVVRRHDAQPNGSISLTVLNYGASTRMPLDAAVTAEISQQPFAFGPSLASVRRMRLLPHIHGQVPGLMAAGPSTHLAGLLSTELMSAAIAAEAIGRAGR
jgi:phytoene dehydrogenase-like protein